MVLLEARHILHAVIALEISFISKARFAFGFFDLLDSNERFSSELKLTMSLDKVRVMAREQQTP
jgi:hypothetical protein